MQFIIKTMMAEESDQGSTLKESRSVIAWVANMREERGPMTPISLRCCGTVSGKALISNAA